MKKVLFGALGLSLLALGAVLVVPGLIDWNEYKGEIATKIKEATGRDVVIGGDLKISVLPVPTLVAQDVRLSNLKGSATANMVALRLLEVRVAFAPLLGGDVQVESVRLIDPVIELEVLPDGRRNWEFNVPAATNKTESGTSSVAGAAGGFSLDSFSISNGSVVYRDRKGGVEERAEGIEAEVSARSLSGPFESRGRLLYQGIPITFRSDIGRVEANKAIPISAGLGIEGVDLDLILSGTILGLSDEPRFQGKLTVAGSGSAPMALTGSTGTVSGFLGQPFQFEGTLGADATGGVIKNAVLGIGDASASGSISLSLKGSEGVPSLAVDLKVPKIDLDHWLAMGPVQVPPFRRQQAVKVSTADGGRKLTGIPSGADKSAKNKGGGLPKGFNAAINLGVDTVVLKGGVISQARLNAELANGEITISQLSAVLPGVTNVAAFGFVVPDAAAPAFEGEIEGTTSDVRGLLGWAGIKDMGIPDGRLQTLRFAAKARVSAEEAQLSRMALEFDKSRLTGGITVALRERPAFGANVTLDTINLDHYLGAASPLASAKTASVGLEKKTTKTGGGAGAGMKAFGALGAFDANLKASIGNMVFQGIKFAKVGFDGTLVQGGLSFRDISIGNVAGASLKAKGGLKGLGGLPEMDNISFQVTSADPSRLFSLTGTKPPAIAKTIGPVHFSGKADGSFLKPRVDATLQVAGAKAQVKGAFSLIPLTSLFDGKISLRHENMTRFLSVLGSGYRPHEKLGGLDVSASLSAGADQIDITELHGQLGPVSIEGQTSVSMVGAQPKVTTSLRTGIIPVKLFLPIEDKGAARPTTTKKSIRSKRARAVGSGVVSSRWSRDPIDFSFLKGLDANIDLQAKGVTFDTYSLSDASLGGTLKGGVLSIDRISGNFFGGPITGTARIDASAKTPRIVGALRLSNMNIGRAVKAVSGKDLADGRMAVNLDVTTKGSAVASMVSTLNGKGSLSITELDVKAGGTGTVLAGVFGLFSGLDNALSSVLSGKKGKKGLAAVSSGFTIKKGVATLSALQFRSSFGNGSAKGAVDLPAWLIDVNGQVTVPDNLIAQILTRNVSREPIPFSIKGDLEAPDVKLKTAGLTGGVKKGLGKVLDRTGLGGILGGGTQPAPGEPAPAPTKKIKPEDVFKSILRGVLKPQ